MHRRVEEAGALQHPWDRLASAQAHLAAGDGTSCRDTLQNALKSFHIADKSEVYFLSPRALQAMPGSPCSMSCPNGLPIVCDAA